MFNDLDLSTFGIVDWGYTEEMNPHSFDHYKKWVGQGDAGPLKYLQDHRRDLRKNLRHVHETTESAVVFLFDYQQTRHDLHELYQRADYNGLKIASYAVAFEGDDYHRVLGERLHHLAGHLKKSYPDLEYALSLDIQPVLERDLAYRAGLGWFGKNSMLISREHGSFFLIGSLLLNRKLDVTPRPLEHDHCGHCVACAEACPTDAIDVETRTLKASQCISTYTIELFDEAQIPEGFEKASGEVFGCDICQDVCPWNKKRERLGLFTSDSSLASLDMVKFYLLRPISKVLEELNTWSNNKFRKTFVKTAMGRTGRKGLLKNLKFWQR